MFSAPIIAVLSIVGLLVLFLVAVALWSSRYMKVGPHEALIVTGRGGQRVVIGGATFIAPVLYKTFKLNLTAQKVDVSRKGIYTSQRVPINVEAVLVYKIQGTQDSVLIAAQALQGKGEHEIQEMIQSIAEGAFRDICGKMTPEQINEDRETFQNKVAEVAKQHFDRLGMDLLTFTVNHISDDQKYFQNLGAPQAADVARTARTRTAEADREATVVEAEQIQASRTAQAQAQAQIFNAERDRDITKAQNDATVSEQRAVAEQAGPKSSAKAQQEVVDAQTILAQKIADLKQKELITEKIRPAEAERESSIAIAEGVKRTTVLKAEGNAEQVKIQAGANAEQVKITASAVAEHTRVVGAADGEAARARGQGEADAIRARLLAEADGTRARLLAEAEGNRAKFLAEAEGIAARADAMARLNEETNRLELAKTFIATLPEMIKAAATPLEQVDSIRIVDFGSNDGHNGNGSGSGSSSGGPFDRLLSISPRTLGVADEVMRSTLGVSLVEMVGLIRKGDVPKELMDRIENMSESEKGNGEGGEQHETSIPSR